VSYQVEQWRSHAPLRIVARLDEPIGYLGDMLHLDGPLAYATYHDLDIATRKTIPPIETAAWPVDLELPLSTWWVDYDPDRHGTIYARLMKRRRRGASGPPPQLWGWCATAADESGWAVRSKLEVRKRPELGKMARYTDARSHNTGSGHMKAYDLAIPTVFAREVTWYAHGDADKVRALLSKHVPALGKKRSTGSGTVREWIVEECRDRDTDGVCVDGQLARRMPFGAVAGSPRHGAIRPPYYHHTRMIMAVEP
jgi:hypothetical protein